MATKLLDAKKVANLKPGPVERIHRDGGGLELRVYPTGGKAWQLRYQFNGKRRVMRLGEYPGVSLKEARAKADDARKLLDSGTDPQVYAEERAEAERIARMERQARRTFRDVFNEWSAAKLSKRKDGPDLVRAFHKDILPVLGDREFGSVTRADLLRCLDAVADRGAKRMANRLLTTVKTFYGWALLRDLVAADPLAPVKAADVGGKLPSRDRVLTDAETVDLLRKLPQCGLSPLVQSALLICLATGCRLGEICKARWEHITGNVWTIPAEASKNGKEHKVTLSPFALAEFDRLRAARFNDWVLPSPKKDGPMTRLAVGAAIYDRQTGGPQRQGRTAATSSLVLDGGRWTAHDLRRSCASGMQRLGVMPAVIDAVLNHKESKGVTQIYQRYDYAKEMADAWARWGQRLAVLRAEAKGIALVVG